MNDQAGEKKRLESGYDRLAVWMKVFTGAVAVGLVMEYLPDVVRAARTRAFPEPLIGALLITIGVAGELLILIWSSRYETKLRELNDSIIKEADLARAKLEARVSRRSVRRDLNNEEERSLVELLRTHAGQKFTLLVS